jgi:DNA polymerase (family 10)
LEKHISQIRKVAKEFDELVIWAGSEVDVLGDGQLDYPDELLAELDFVVASVHAGMGSDSKVNTRRTLKAIENPYVNLIAHPTARLLNRRDAKPLDIEALAEAAAETGTALEINASDHRLDLKDTHARLAMERGAVISINCDAHAADEFAQLKFGVLTARRAGLRRDAVLNTWTAEHVRAFVARKRP